MKLIRLGVLSTLYLLFLVALSAQNSGDNLFDDSYVHEVRFEFEQANFFDILTDNFDSVYDPLGEVPYLLAKVRIDGELIDSVGVRFKGFTSYSSGRKKNPLKIDFNEFVAGQRYDGLRKLNLNNGTGDPAMQRDNVCYELMRSTGVHAPRTGYARVYLNDEYWGLYQLIEQIDKEFIQNNFKNNQGNLFKNKAWSHLEYLGDSKSDYEDTFQLKTNKEEDDWSGFINFLDVLNNAPDEDFASEIEKIFNVDLFLKTLAGDVATDNWDSYLQHGRNYYMYEDTETGIFNWIPWDYNFALGGTFGGGGGGSEEECFVSADQIGWTDGSNSVKFINNSFSSQTAGYTWDFGDGNTSNEESPTHMFDMPGVYNVCLTVYVDQDCQDTTCREIDTSYDYNTCPSIVNGEFSGSASENFVTLVIFAPECCNVWGEECANFYSFLSDNGGGLRADFSIDQKENTGILISRLLNVPEFNFKYNAYFCELLENEYTTEKYDAYIENNRVLIEEHIMEDPNYLYGFEDFEEDSGEEGLKRSISDRIDTLQLELPTLFDCESITTIIPFQNITINELVASNDSTSNISDAQDEHEDWIELYNNSDQRINLSGVYLSNDETDLEKWAIPIGTFLAPNEYLIIWADEDEEQIGLHANFKISKSGGKIWLSNNDRSLIDEVEFGAQETNIAYARIPNGTGNFITQAPTFDGDNEVPTSVANTNYFSFQVYPNPVTDFLQVKIQAMDEITLSVEIYTLTGQKVLTTSTQGYNGIDINTSSLIAGFYTLVMKDEEGNRGTTKFVKR